MRSLAFGLLLSLPLPFVAASKTSLRRVALPRQTTATGDDTEDVTLVDTMNIVYMANVTIGGTEYPVQLDTGSSDLWIKTSSGALLPNSQATSLTYNISYSIGYAAGTIVTAPVTFAGFTVNSQAILSVTSSNNPIFQYGATGILGLGFSSISNIDQTVTGAGQSYGKPFLANAFAQNTSEPNFIAFTLGRQTPVVESVFAIGELESQYNGILQTQPISTFPVRDPQRWTVLMDGWETADGIKRTLNSTSGPDVPAGQAVLLLDTGASYAYAPQEVTDALYSGVPGATFDSSSGMWTVPCNQEINFALWIGQVPLVAGTLELLTCHYSGRKFDWHPLDVVVQSVSNSNACVGSIQPSSDLEGFDFYAGDVFLRALYTVLDFGDYDSTGNLGDPYVRLWSLIDQPTASAEFHKQRGGTTQPYKSSSTVSANAASANANTPTGAGTANAVTSDQQLYTNVNTLVKYAPIALGILGLNAILLLVVVAGGVWYICCRRKGRRGNKTLGGLGAGGSGGLGASLSRNHSYQKVKSEDVETPLHQLSFNGGGPSGSVRSGKHSHSSSYYAGKEEQEPFSPDDGEVTAVNESFRMSTLKGGIRDSHITSPSKGSLRLGASNLSAPGTPNNVQDPLPSAGLQSNFSGVSGPHAEESPSGSDSHEPEAGSSAGPSRTQDYLAAMEARKAALAGVDPSKRSTYHELADEVLQPPPRRFPGAGLGPDGRRAMSSYGSGAEPAPLQVPPRRQPSIQEQQQEGPAQDVLMPPGPSRSQEFQQTLEARRAALQAGSDDQSRRTTYHDPEPLQPPTRRFQGADGGRRALSSYMDGEGERATVYFDAQEAPAIPQSPMGAGVPRGSVYETPGRHNRSGSNASGTQNRSPLSSPSRATFQQTQTPPRATSNLNPNAPSSRPAGPAMTNASHGRSGSYAGPGMAAPRAPPQRYPQPWQRPRNGSQGPEETDLTEQRPSFDERAELEQEDAFADGAAPPRPFAPAPGYRYSSMH